MAADDKGMDLPAVGIPVFGIAAWKPDGTPEDLVASADGGKADFKLPDDYINLGLYKPDGGKQEANEAGDPIEFFQQGYKLSGDITRTVAITFAQTDKHIRQVISGKTPDENGMIIIDDTDNEAVFPLFVETLYKNKTIERLSGMARVATVEVGQETRGENKGYPVTFEWVYEDTIDGLYRHWLVNPSEGTTPPTPKASLKLTMTADKAQAKPGDVILCSLKAHNAGNATFAGTITNDLSQLVTGADYNENANASDGTVAFTSPELVWTGNIGPGDTLSVTYTVSVKAEAEPGTLLTNTINPPEDVESACDPTCAVTIEVTAAQALKLKGKTQ